MDDQDLRSALREHDDVERGLRFDERARIVARLNSQPAEPAAIELVSEAPPAVDITPTPSTTDQRRPSTWIAAAAAALVLAGLFFLAGPRQFNGDVDVVAEVDGPTPVPISSPTPVPPPAPTCPAAVTEFILAIDAWDGIETWASLIDGRRPDPDLPTLGAAAVDVWRSLAVDDPLLTGLEIEVAEPLDDLSESRADLIVRRSAPLQTAFDRMRVASTDTSSVLAPCTETIEVVAAELGLPAVVTDDG